ncbi:MAG TPA: reverse transcriptase family protein [Pirellulales bacterium]|jgi:retron-type reverse transcriptase
MHRPADIASALATVFLADVLDAQGMAKRGAQLLGRRWRWLLPLARRACMEFGDRPPPRQRVLAQFIACDDGFHRACQNEAIKIIDRVAAKPEMRKVGVANAWDVPTIRTTGELAAWLCVTMRNLEWYADRGDLNGKQSTLALRHYHYRVLAKCAEQIRLIEAPKLQLKRLQRQILTGVLERIPVHDAAHGFRRGRSIKTFAAPHVGKDVVLRLDLKEFFPSIRAARVQALFRTAGYPERVADLMAGLCTHATPVDVWREAAIDFDDRLRVARNRYSCRHLPQGAVTSPAIANLCAYRLDCRIAGLAGKVGATYTRYADDLVVSGGADFARVVKRFGLHIAVIAAEEGFAVNHRKTRIMRAGVSQHVAGIVVNERLNTHRQDYDRLKAILTNCVRHGVVEQNREHHGDFQAHLRGRISFVESINASRGARLQAIFERISW